MQPVPAVVQDAPRHDVGLADIATMLAQLTAALREANDLADRRNGSTGLSAAELRLAENAKAAAPCILEEDATLRFGDHEIGLTLRAYGRWHKAYRGQFERGGLQLTPAEPAHYEIDSVTISSGSGSIETEIYNALNEDALEEIGMAAYEECPQ